ncbi:MAG: glucokinase [Vicinamibacteria bacterium]
MILAGDAGGTNTRLALCRVHGLRVELLDFERYPSANYENLAHIVREFAGTRRLSVEKGCFGVAGPVADGRSRISNLEWEVVAEELAEVLGLPEVHLVNDVEAQAWGVASLVPRDFVVMNSGDPDAAGNQALIAAGTGLGEAGLHLEANGYRPFASEGGHEDFAPRNETETALLLYLLQEYSHVSYERVLSGPGLHNVYRFLRDTGREEEPRWLSEEMRGADPPPIISRLALERGGPAIAARALDLFTSIYGAEASNLGLKLLATGGIFVGGGIAPRILPKLQDGLFMKSFVQKGRMSELVAKMPVKVIVNEFCALYGAARLTVEPLERGGV